MTFNTDIAKLVAAETPKSLADPRVQEDLVQFARELLVRVLCGVRIVAAQRGFDPNDHRSRGLALLLLGSLIDRDVPPAYGLDIEEVGHALDAVLDPNSIFNRVPVGADPRLAAIRQSI